MKTGEIQALNFKALRDLKSTKSDSSCRSSFSLTKSGLKATAEVTEEDSPLITRAKTEKASKVSLFKGFDLQSAFEEEQKSPVTPNLAGGLSTHDEPTRFRDFLKKQVYITEERSNSHSNSNSGSSSSSNSPSIESKSLSDADDDNEDKDGIEELFKKPTLKSGSKLNSVRPASLSPTGLKLPVFGKVQPSNNVPAPEKKTLTSLQCIAEDPASFGAIISIHAPDKTSIILQEKSSESTSKHIDNNTTSLMFECEDQLSARKEFSKASLGPNSIISDFNAPRPRKPAHEVTFKGPTLLMIKPTISIREVIGEEQQTSPTKPKRRSTLTIANRREIADALKLTTKVSLDSLASSALAQNAVPGNQLSTFNNSVPRRSRAGTSPIQNNQKPLLLLPTPQRHQTIIGNPSRRTSLMVSDTESKVPSLKDGSRILADDFGLDEPKDRKGKDVTGSMLFDPAEIERGYHSDSQVKAGVRVNNQQLIGMSDFEPLKMIGRGAFGRVFLVRRKATNDLYAMKVINLTEKFMKNTKELENLKKENKVFGLAKEDFVVRAVFTFIYETCICFVMEYMIGGDFGDILYNYSALEEDVAKFYIAEIILAVDYLHSLGIVHSTLR